MEKMAGYPESMERCVDMEPWVEIVIAVLASSGFWAIIQKITERKDAKTQMLVGLAHDRIISLGINYIERGYITEDEFENLYEYLYIPYSKMGGNGSAKQIMERVKQLPLKVR